MAGEWETKQLQDIAELSGGFAFKSQDYSPSGRFILRTLNIENDASINRDVAVYLPDEKCRMYERFELQEHDTLFVMVGATLGKVGLVRRETLPALLNQNMWRIRARENICDKRYLQYAFRRAVAERLGWASGSARNFVRRDDYRKMGIPVPPLTEQKAIASVLGALDDKIELNRRMNATLEAMAQALFQSWFVDFDPVRAKLDGREPVGLDSAVAELFPGAFQDSELGNIPQGWRTGSLGQIGTNVRRSVQPQEIVQGTPYIALEHMPRRSISLNSWEEANDLASSKSVFRKDEILFGKLRPYFHKIGLAPLDGVCSTDILVITPRNPDWLGFLLGHLSSEALIQFTDLASTGTKMPRTSWRDISRYKVVLPPDAISGTFSRQIRPMLKSIARNIFESRTLANLRDTLLPKLLSGELSVKNIESQVAAVV